MPNAIDIENLSLIFNGKSLLDNFRLTVGYGEHVMLDGPSGSGKTSLLRCVLGFIQPQSGTIKIDDEKLTAQTVWAIRNKIAYLPQQPEFNSSIALDALKQPFSYKANKSKTEKLNNLPHYLDELRLTKDILDKQIKELSGGEKQRLVLIQAMLLDRKILLLDEPTSALDKESKKAVLDLLEMQKSIAILSVSHDPEVKNAATRKVDLQQVLEVQ